MRGGFVRRRADRFSWPIPEISDGESWTLRMLSEMPLAAADDLALRGMYSQVRYLQLLQDLQVKGLVASVRLGGLRSVRRRWFLTRNGVRVVYPHHNGYVPWPITESGLKRLVRRLPAVEAIYPGVATLLNDGKVSLPSVMLQPLDPYSSPVDVPSGPKLSEFSWVREGPIHAVARYHDQLLVPIAWVGLWGLSPSWGNRQEGFHLAHVEFYKALFARQSRVTPDEVRPSAWAFFVIDEWAYQQVRVQLHDIDPKAVFLNGQQVEDVQLQACDLRIIEADPLGKLGNPEKLENWVLTNPAVAALNGTTARRAAMVVEEWPPGEVRDIALACGFAETNLSRVLAPLTEAGILAEYGGQFYLGYAGMSEAAQRDRLSARTIHSRFDQFIRESDARRQQFRINDRRLLQMVGRWKALNVSVAAGWRGELAAPGVTTLAPDARIYIRGRRGINQWHFVEYERTAVTPAAIRNKLDGYTTIAGEGVPVGLAVVCETAAAARRFREIGFSLDMITNTYSRVAESENRLDAVMFQARDQEVFILGDISEFFER